MAKINRLSYFLALRILTILFLGFLIIANSYIEPEAYPAIVILCPLTIITFIKRFNLSKPAEKKTEYCNWGFGGLILFLVLIDFAIIVAKPLGYLEIKKVYYCLSAIELIFIVRLRIFDLESIKFDLGKYLKCILIVILFMVNEVKSQVLPNDPVKFDNIPRANWLKKSTELALAAPYNDDLYDYGGYFNNYTEVLTTIANNSSLATTVFFWVRPYIKSKIDDLKPIEKIKLFNSLMNAITYLENLNISYEYRYLQSSENSFLSMDPHAFFGKNWDHPYPDEIIRYENNRPFESFLFRRIRDGVSKSVLVYYLKEVLKFVDVKFQRTDVHSEDFNNLFDFTWNFNHFEGKFKEYSYTYINSDKKLYLRVSGQYSNGLKSGLWKYYNINGDAPMLDHEIEYESNKPVFFTKYYSERLRAYQDEFHLYYFVFKLNILSEVLDVAIYKEQKLYKSFSSISNLGISFWDIYDTQRRLIHNIEGPPNEEIAIDKRITLEDKPKVERDPKTHNYVLYDELKRSGKDHALLIGIEDYTYTNFHDLNNPVRDAQSIAYDLEDIYGFNCEIIKNPSKADLIAVFNRYKKMDFGNDGQLFVFISGHGSRENSLQEGYIVPVNGLPTSLDFNHNSWMSYSEIYEIFSTIKSNHILIAIDACYSGSLETVISKMKSDEDEDKFTDTKNWFYRRFKFKTFRYFTSTAADRESSDGINHSPFASMFMKSLRTFGDKTHILTAEEILPDLQKVLPTPLMGSFRSDQREGSFFFIMQ